MESAAELQDYVRKPHAILATVAEADPSTELRAAVTFRRPLQPHELEEFLADDLVILYVEWEASNGIVGGRSAVSGLRIEDIESELRDRGRLAVADSVLGFTYAVVEGPAGGLDQLSRAPLVFSVDGGALERLIETRSRGDATARVSTPMTLYHRMKRLDR